MELMKTRSETDTPSRTGHLKAGQLKAGRLKLAHEFLRGAFVAWIR